MKKGLTIICWLGSVFVAFAQIPAGYYDSANGLTGEDLRTALHNIIKGHNQQTYNSLHTHYQTTDKKSNGKVWDMYSDVPGGSPSYEYSFISADQCGNYSGEGDCYNREHSFPQDWFSSGYPMQSDLFHVYPTDGYVNGKRNNYPYGNVGTATWTSTNGSKLGSSATAGYSGTVFEPIDEYKGDFARTYFYMVTRYKDVASGWSSVMLTGDNLSNWAIDLLLDWSRNDTVSQKEIDRNNAVYGIQNNRNPYIDDPVYIEKVWGNFVDHVGEKQWSDISMYYYNGKLSLQRNDAVRTELVVLSALGQQMGSYNINSTTTSLDLNLQPGVYIARCSGETLKFIAF